MTTTIPSAKEVADLESRRLYLLLLGHARPGTLAKNDPSHQRLKERAPKSREIMFLTYARELLEVATGRPVGEVLAGPLYVRPRQRARAFGAYRRNTPMAALTEIGRGRTSKSPRDLPGLLRAVVERLGGVLTVEDLDGTKFVAIDFTRMHGFTKVIDHDHATDRVKA